MYFKYINLIKIILFNIYLNKKFLNKDFFKTKKV
jgi:hypothetical protein